MKPALPKDDHRPVFKTPQELVHIKHRISLLQYKYWVLMLRSYREAYENKGESLSDDDYCYMPMKELAKHLGYSPRTSEIEEDLEAIRKEPIIFNVLEKDGNKGKSGRGFISEWYVSSNKVGVVFPPLIREAIENLDSKQSIFHLLNWSIFNSFTGKYEAILYKLCKDYVGVGKTPYMPIETFRDYMGVREGEYSDFKRLNQWVISGPTKKINGSEVSDITIEIEYKREARKVIGLWFHVQAKKQTALDFGDNPAFRLAKVTIPLIAQRKYLETKGHELIELGIQRANEYGEEQEKQGKEVNYGALYRKAIEEDWGLEYASKLKREAEKLQAKQKKNAAEQANSAQRAQDDIRNKFERKLIDSMIKSLSAEDNKIYVEKFQSEKAAGEYDFNAGSFINKLENARFKSWLRTQIKPMYTEQEFEAWQKETK